MRQSSGWRRVVVSEVCESIIDCVNKTAPVVEERTPFKMIRTTNVRGGWVELDEVKYVTEEVFSKWTRRQVPRRGDVILTREAPLGEVGMLRTDDSVFLGQRLVSYRADPSKLDNRFLLYAFQELDLQSQIKALGSGATVEHMRVPDAERLTLRLPPLPTQRRIADILSAYDDLIENNARRIKILEEMARSLYREWFVELRFPGHEPVRITRRDGIARPPDWKVVQLSQIAAVNERSIRRGAEPEVVDYVDIAAVSAGEIGETQRYAFHEAPGRARRLVAAGDTIWSMVRPNRRSHALVLDPEPTLVVSTGFAVLTPKGVPASFLHTAATTDAFVAYLVNRARGAAYPAVTGEDFEAAEIVLPPAELLAAFDALAGPAFKQAHLLRRQSAVLRVTRDHLLARLVSGEIELAP